MLMNEYLIMKGFTLNDTLEVVKKIGTGIDFPTAFQSVYKISTAEFYKQLREYLKTLDYGW
jgi:poly(A) polymerase Pap1